MSVCLFKKTFIFVANLKMNLEKLRDYCLKLEGTTEDFPFDGTTLVFRINGKIYALTDIEDFRSVNLKCNPDKAIALRASYPEHILPGYHMNKKHWNTVILDNYLSKSLIEEMIKDSYWLVRKK